MSVKLFYAPYFVTAVGQLGQVTGFYPDEMFGFECRVGDLWGCYFDERGNRMTGLPGDRIIKLFPTEAEARAYLTRKPWYRRWGWLPWVGAIITGILILMACTPTKPCEEVWVLHPDSTGLQGGNMDSGKVEVCGE